MRIGAGPQSGKKLTTAVCGFAVVGESPTSAIYHQHAEKWLHEVGVEEPSPLVWMLEWQNNKQENKDVERNQPQRS